MQEDEQPGAIVAPPDQPEPTPPQPVSALDQVKAVAPALALRMEKKFGGYNHRMCKNLRPGLARKIKQSGQE